MIVHIFPNDKFVLDYIERTRRLFDVREHFFIVMSKGEYIYESDLSGENFQIIDIKSQRKLFEQYIDKSQRIILHGLFFPTISLNLIAKYSKIKKMIWVIWGGDLYDDYERIHSFKGIFKIYPLIREYYRKIIIKNLYMVLSGCDYENLVHMYKTNAKKASAQYSYNLVNNPLVNTSHEQKYVMVGHSATSTCQHIETFELLAQFKGLIKVFCPLSYPQNPKYIAKVIKEGRKMFGDDFIPITEYMNYNKYIDFLKKIDIGVFNNNRQQGMGNVTNLLYLGKKVYLSKNNNIRKIYYHPEYVLFSFEEIDANFTKLLSVDEKNSNCQKIRQKFSDQVFQKEWDYAFNG